MNTMFAGPRRVEFEQKLIEDLQLIGSKADIIGLQEVAPFWHNFISERILGNWTSASIMIDGIVTFVSPSWTVVGSPQTRNVFPEEGSMHRDWRKWLQVIVQNDKGDIYLVNNLHTIDGKGERKIPGNNAEARDRFKQSVVRHVIAQSFAMAPAATRGQIRVGDFNMDLPCAQQALSSVGGGAALDLWGVGAGRDFIFSTLPLLLIEEGNMPSAMDGQHKAMLAVVTWPSAAPPPASLPLRRAVEQKAETLARTLLQQLQAREAEAQAQDEAEAKADEETRGRRHLEEARGGWRSEKRRCRMEAEEDRRRREQAQAEELYRRRQEEDDRRRREQARAQELDRRRQEEDDRRRREQAQAEEEPRRQEEEQRRRAHEDLARRTEELRVFQEEMERRRHAVEVERSRREEERRRQERVRQEQEQLRRQQEEEEQRRRQEEEEQRRRQEEEEQRGDARRRRRSSGDARRRRRLRRQIGRARTGRTLRRPRRRRSHRCRTQRKTT